MQELIFIESKAKMPLTELEVRTVVVPVGQKFVIISPGSAVDPTQYQRDWDVEALVAPNLFHTAGLNKAHQAYPSAKIWGPPKSEKKQGLPKITNILGVDQWPYSETLEPVYLRGMPSVEEVVFIHKPTRSLIVADLCFNIGEAKDWGGKFIFKIFGTYNRFGTSRLFASAVKDKRAFAESVDILMAKDFDKIVICHGQNVMSQGKMKLAAALQERSLID